MKKVQGKETVGGGGSDNERSVTDSLTLGHLMYPKHVKTL